jgi:parvulin-like peptidyl-prolyl isomerase
MRTFALLSLFALALPACGGESGGGSAATMDAAIAALMAKPEQPDESITVQHVLIAFQGAPRITGVTRNKDEAKVLAEKVWNEAIGGADFQALMKTHSNDSGPGEYAMTKAGRAGMVASFGNVGFRLKVGEIGVAAHDEQASPYGWHIIKRVK